MKNHVIAGLLFFFTLPLYSQITAIPDPNFEQALIDLNIDSDGVINGQVLTSDISSLTSLNVNNKNISDLTGIEDFVSLTDLICYSNNLSSLNMTNNMALERLYCYFNNISSVDVSNNTALITLDIGYNNLSNLNVANNIDLKDLQCHYNNLSSLNVDNNKALERLICYFNNLISVDVSNNTGLNYLDIGYNNLGSLNVKNGNNTNFTEFDAANNPNLTCIEVDDPAYSNVNWTNIDSQTSFNEDCHQTSIHLNGSTDYIAVRTSPSLNIEGSFTIEAWINPDNISGEKTILIKGNNGQCGNYGLFIKDGNLAFVSAGDCNWAVSRGPNSVLQIGVWQHVAAVSSGNNVNLYIDGQLKDTLVRNAAAGAVNGDELWIGRSIFSTTNYFFNGLIDEVRIWDVVKSQTELQSNMDTELTGLESNLMAYYKMDDIELDCDIEDCSINENHGTRININDSANLPKFSLNKPTNLTSVECGIAFSNCISLTFQDIFQLFVDSLMAKLQNENASAFLNDEAQVTVAIQDIQYYYKNRSQIVDEYYNFLVNLCDTYPQYFKINITFDDVQYKFLGSFREQVHTFLRDYLRDYPEKEPQFISALDLANSNAVKYLDIWNNYDILIVDNYSLTELQLDAIDNLLATLPDNVTNLGVILYREFYTDWYENAIYITQFVSAINSFGYLIGTSSYPSSFNNFVTDGFSYALSHEICHTIDYDYLRLNPRLNNWKDAMLSVSGTTYNEYLTTWPLDSYGNDFFIVSPQEFFAYISGAYFSNSALTLELAIERFNAGFEQPINQFLLMADVLSKESNNTQFYTIDENSNIDLGYYNIERNNLGFISGIYLSDTSKLEFLYDENNFVSQILVQDLTRINIKMFLQGAYDVNTGLMNDGLRANGLIPTTSPYADVVEASATLFNTGGTSTTGLAEDDMVDWVWLELRDKINQTTVVTSRSALLQRDGDVVDIDGLSSILFDADNQDYFVVVSHRNHLGIQTASTFKLEEGVVNLDLKSDSNLVSGGTNAIKDMGDGSFALFAGDFNGDGQVQNTDKNAVEPLRGISGYNNADVDMNGEVQNSDLNSVLNPNIGKGEQFMSKKLNAKRKKIIK